MKDKVGNDDRRTYPEFSPVEVSVVAGDDVEDDQDPEDGVVGSQSVNGAELPIVDYIDPAGEEQDLGYGVQYDLQHQQGRGFTSERSFLVPVPKTLFWLVY